MKFLGHAVSMEDTRRRYRRGYHYGRRNQPLAMSPHENSAAFWRGYCAGQGYLYNKIEEALKARSA